jgi:ketosteroid isomerase-like protein
MRRFSDHLVGLAAAFVGMALLRRLLVIKFRADLKALNDGDYRPLLSGYAEDAVLRFNDGPHRFAGEHRGRDAIEVFLRNFTAAGLQGEVVEAWTKGPPWALSIAARFDDRATGPDGEEIYSNQVMLRLQTRWGKIVEHEDFYVDTGRVNQLEEKLTELGIDPVD